MTHPPTQMAPNSPPPHHPSSPPLPNIHSLNISPYPQSPSNHSHILSYGMNGVFAPMNGGIGQGWGMDKRGGRNGIPQGWYDHPSHSPAPPFDTTYRNSSPALSPPTSSSSIPSASSNMFNHNYHHSHQQPPPYPDPYHPAMSAIGLANSPSPPPFLNGLNNPTPPPMSIHTLPNNLNPNPYGQPGMQRYRSPPFPVSESPVPDLSDDIIPTAIVIKNIPFSVPRESLLSIIESLGAPLPYAFNYHTDQGIFRGLAFANFRQPDEAQSVVAALNGYDVSGRKLRVEYKKVLQPGEKDRIEREKALKRMRSVTGFDKSNLNGTGNGGGVGNGNLSTSPNGESQLQSTSPVNTSDRFNINPSPINVPRSSNSTFNMNGHSQLHLAPSPTSHDLSDHTNSPPHSATSSTNSDNLPINLDMNDPITLDIYSRCLLFKEDRMRDELSFSKTLSPMERRVVHLVAGKLGLKSSTRGELSENRCVLVTRLSPTLPSKSTLSNNSSTNTNHQSYLSPYSSSSLDSSEKIRIKKSMPDLRGFTGPSISRDPARSLTSQRSSGNLRTSDNTGSGSRDYNSMGPSSSRRLNGSVSGSSFQGIFNSSGGGGGGDVPPVPPLPRDARDLPGLHTRASFSFDHNHNNNKNDDFSSFLGSGSGSGANVTRHPRGPGTGESKGFGGAFSGNTNNTSNNSNGFLSNGFIGDGVGGGRTLRTSVSAVLRPTPAFGTLGWGKVKEEKEDNESVNEKEEVVEGTRTRESLDL